MIDRYREIYGAFRWNVPPRFDIAHHVCRRWASDPGRVALHWEDESGERRTLTFREILLEANRLSNALRALGVAAGDRVALLLPQRPQTVVSYVACFQMGAIAVPLSFLFGPDALEYRLAHSGARVAIADPVTLANLEPVRPRLPDLAHVLAVAGARGPATLDWDETLARAAPQFDPPAIAACDPAAIIYTSGTTGPPKGTLLPHCALLGNLPGFELLPRRLSARGRPLLVAGGLGLDRRTVGRADAHALPRPGDPRLPRALRPGARPAPDGKLRAFATPSSFPTALKMMMKAVPSPRRRHDLRLRSLMSGGEALGQTVLQWAREELGVTINEIFGQTEMNYIVGNSHEQWPVKPGSMGRPYPGHRIAVIDPDGCELGPGQAGDVAVHRTWTDGTPDPVFFLGYWRNPEATRGEVQRRMVPHGRRGRVRRGRIPLVPGPRRRRLQERGLSHRPVRDRELPGEAPRGGQLRGRSHVPMRRAARSSRRSWSSPRATRLPRP